MKIPSGTATARSTTAAQKLTNQYRSAMRSAFGDSVSTGVRPVAANRAATLKAAPFYGGVRTVAYIERHVARRLARPTPGRRSGRLRSLHQRRAAGAGPRLPSPGAHARLFPASGAGRSARPASLGQHVPRRRRDLSQARHGRRRLRAGRPKGRLHRSAPLGNFVTDCYLGSLPKRQDLVRAADRQTWLRAPRKCVDVAAPADEAEAVTRGPHPRKLRPAVGRRRVGVDRRNRATGRQRPLRGSKASTVSRFESSPAVRPATAYTKSPRAAAARCSRGLGPRITDQREAQRSKVSASRARRPGASTPPTT